MKNTDYIIREIKEDEIDYANKLLNKLIIDEKQYDENINENYVVNNYYQNRQNNSILLVATLNNEIVAFLFGYIIDSLVYIDKKAILDALYVSKNHRKKGLANLLINNFNNVMGYKNRTHLQIWVSKDGENFYKKIDCSGASGPTVLPLFLFNNIVHNKKYKKILLLATGSLHSPLLVNQKMSIPSVTHALEIEVVR